MGFPGATGRAARRAAILLSLVLDVPVLARAVESVTREPEVAELDVDGVPVELVRPGGRGPWPAFVFVTGAHPERRREPVVQRVSRGLARAGYLVLVPDLPGLGEGELTHRTLDAAVAVAEAGLARPEVRGGRVALSGASTGASLALLAAVHPRVADRVSVVAAITPFADLEKIVCLATTRHYGEDGRYAEYPVTDLLRRVVARSIVAALPPGADRERLLDCLRECETEGVDALDRLDTLEGESLSADTRAVLSLLCNRDPSAFGELYRALPDGVAAVVAGLSPLGAARDVHAPVEIIVPPTDQYFPSEEAASLAAALGYVRLTVTGTLDHTRPIVSLGRVSDLVRLLGFVVRSLAAADR